MGLFTAQSNGNAGLSFNTHLWPVGIVKGFSDTCAPPFFGIPPSLWTGRAELAMGFNG
jgi:hypothetical protein